MVQKPIQLNNDFRCSITNESPKLNQGEVYLGNSDGNFNKSEVPAFGSHNSFKTFAKRSSDPKVKMTPNETDFVTRNYGDDDNFYESPTNRKNYVMQERNKFMNIMNDEDDDQDLIKPQSLFFCNKEVQFQKNPLEKSNLSKKTNSQSLLLIKSIVNSKMKTENAESRFNNIKGKYDNSITSLIKSTYMIGETPRATVQESNRKSLYSSNMKSNEKDSKILNKSQVNLPFENPNIPSLFPSSFDKSLKKYENERRTEQKTNLKNSIPNSKKTNNQILSNRTTKNIIPQISIQEKKILELWFHSH